MNVLRDMSELKTLRGPVAFAVGVFDGVHLGHQAVIQSAIDFTEKHGGTTVVLTFDPHPLRVLRPDSAPLLLCSTAHKLHILKQFGVDHVLVLPFTSETAKTDASAFIAALVSSCQPLGFISVGYTWSFGRGREGNVHQLMEMGQIHGFGVYGVPEVKIEEEVVSSTLIREAVRTGNFQKAEHMLGRPYTVMGEVVKGRQLGRQLGFPTANVAIENEELPPSGVYAVEAILEGRKYPGVANLGRRPTIEKDGEQILEVYLLDLDVDLYGAYLEVSFVKLLRQEQKFAGLEELKSQIARDIDTGRTVFSFRASADAS
ncbi:bifunctional riboflavin kinase/FAD synthetase [soil metagenome]